MKISLAWGESIAVRQAFNETISFNPMVIGPKEIADMSYTPFEGDHNLIETTKKVLKRQIGLSYNYVLLTNGASGGIISTLMAYRDMNLDTAITIDPPYFSLYPSMIKSAGLIHKTESNKVGHSSPVLLVDSPSNPRGIFAMDNPKGANISTPVIFDAVYNNNVYVNPLLKRSIVHDVVIGSYSKLLGVNGTRIGWIALNDPLLYERLKTVVMAQYCGLSKLSMDFLNKVLENFDWERFELSARNKLDYNREEWSKLERYLQHTPVPQFGMFHYTKIDNSARALLELSNIEWMSGSRLGHSDDYGRFNIGQDPNIIKEVVKIILRNDGI